MWAEDLVKVTEALMVDSAASELAGAAGSAGKTAICNRW